MLTESAVTPCSVALLLSPSAGPHGLARSPKVSAVGWSVALVSELPSSPAPPAPPSLRPPPQAAAAMVSTRTAASHRRREIRDISLDSPSGRRRPLGAAPLGDPPAAAGWLLPHVCLRPATCR